MKGVSVILLAIPDAWSVLQVNLVRTDIEASKSDTLKWVIVTVVGLLGAGFAAIRLSLA